MAQTCAQAQAWVKENYELHENGVVAKSVIYKNYEEFCKHNGRPVMETSIFGRVVKQVFPEVQIRRLGGRDNLKYYYCGIQAQLDSPHVNDNQNTIRPKRRQRKRASITDKAEAQNCLRWLFSNYIYDAVSSISKNDLYEHYIHDNCSSWATTLSAQDFVLVVIDGFSKLGKRKISSKLQQQGFFLGFKKRPEPLDPTYITGDLISPMESIIGHTSSSVHDFREGSNTPDDDCYASPESEEGSDPWNTPYKDDSLVHEEITYDDDVPVDYSLPSLKVKEELIDIKEEKMSGDENISSYSGYTPERPPSNLMESPTPSPSPPQKSTRPKLYKPRFHINYHESNEWELPSEPENHFSVDSAEDVWDLYLKKWLMKTLESSPDCGVNRDQVYAMYERHCQVGNSEILPLAHFDKVVFKLHPGTVTRIHNHGVTLYEGIRINYASELRGHIQEISFRGPEEGQWNDLERPMDLSSPNLGVSEPMMSLCDDEYDEPIPVDQYREVLDDDDAHSIPDILKDGKYYLKSWLKEHFEPIPEACVLKADAYRCYEQFAHSQSQCPFEMNVFGKIVRQVFPKVSIRRLGGRQKPQYHYCGISPKSSSPLYSILGGKDPAQRSRKKEISTDSLNTESAISWLENSFQINKKGIIMKTDVYERYKYYCGIHDLQPHNLNYFGKLVKHCFPEVEVRKSGGRTEPTWFYYGLSYKDNSLNSSFPSSYSMHEYLSHQNASQPISVPADISVSNSSPYCGSPHGLPMSNPYHMGAEHLSRSTHCLASLNEFSSEPYPRSPDLSRAFQEHLRTRGPIDSSRMLVRSPDVAPDIFPKSPEGSAAQICRSPSFHQFPPISSDSSMISYSNHGQIFSSSPTNKRSVQLVPSQTPPSMEGLHDSSHLLHKKLKQQLNSESSYNHSGRS